MSWGFMSILGCSGFLEVFWDVDVVKLKTLIYMRANIDYVWDKSEVQKMQKRCVIFCYVIFKQNMSKYTRKRLSLAILMTRLMMLLIMESVEAAFASRSECGAYKRPFHENNQTLISKSFWFNVSYEQDWLCSTNLISNPVKFRNGMPMHSYTYSCNLIFTA